MGNMAEKKKKQAPFGCLFWIAFILLVFALFFINKNNIAESLRGLERSGFFNKEADSEKPPTLAPRTKDDGEIHLEMNAGTESPAETVGGGEARGDGVSGAEEAPHLQKPDDITELTAPNEAEKTADAQSPSATGDGGKTPHGASDSAGKKTGGAPIQMRTQRLYFVSIDPEGRVLRQEVVKDIPKSDSPLSDALAALFAGPSSAEQKKGLISLIPPGTRLLSATVKNGMATLNISDEFRFNQHGIEGYLAQLAQIVFTATTFPTVDTVQFLIDGQKLDYLTEGVWIGTPLGRKEFSN